MCRQKDRWTKFVCQKETERDLEANEGGLAGKLEEVRVKMNERKCRGKS